MKNQLQRVFNFNGTQIRTVLIDGVIWFIGKDVAAILGYSNTNDAIKRHVYEEDKKDGVVIHDPMGRKQQAVAINESGVYALIFHSKLPAAQEFSHWVTSEVLPELRKTGTVSLESKDSYLIEDPIERAKQWIKEAEERKQLEIANKDMQPKAEVYDAIVSDDSTISIGELALYIEQQLKAKGRKVHIGRTKLFIYLRSNGYLFKSGSQYNLPTAKAMKLGLFKTVKREITKGKLAGTFKAVSRATGKAQGYFAKKSEEIIKA